MFFDLMVANVAIVDWICWKAGSLEQNQLLWHRLFPINPARCQSGSSQWIHHFNDGQRFANLSPLCWSETPNSMCFKNGWHLQWWENHRFIVFQIMLSQAPRAPTRLWPTWRVTAETCWAIEPTIHQYEWKTEMWVEPLTHQQYWRFFALPIRKHTKKNTQPTIQKWFNRIKNLDNRW